MPDPRDAHLPIREIGEKGVEMGAEAFCEEGGDENLREKIAFVPALLRAQADTARLGRGASSLGGSRGAGFAGNLFPFFHRREILTRTKAGAMNDSFRVGFPRAGRV